jgi:hypothetical protein
VLTKNLMDASRVQSVIPGTVVATSVDDSVLIGADLIILDLATGIDPSEVVAIGPPVVAYGPHVDREALDAAVAAGCRQALSRSQIFRRLPELVDPT